MIYEEKKAKCLSHDIRFIDPAECGSSIGYRFTEDGYAGVYGSVTITECTKMVSWSIACDGQEGLTKLDNAIAILMEARAACLEGIERQKVLTEEENKRKAAEAAKRKLEESLTTLPAQ